jgi:hypothetical protein
MLRSLLVLFVLALAWVLILWFALPFQITDQPISVVLLAHALPPLVLWSGWLLVVALRKRRRAQALAREQAATEAERQQALAGLQERQAAELARLRFGCDCRAAVITGLSVGPDILEAALPPADTPDGEDDEPEDAEEDADFPTPERSPAMAEFAGPLKQALEAIYQSAPAALALPVFVLPPVHVAAADAFEATRDQIIEIAEALECGDIMEGTGVQVRFVPGGDAPSESILRIFDHQTDLPGALILAFDSPAQRDEAAFEKAMSSEERATITAAIRDRSTWLGEPQTAVVALLITHPEVESMLTSICDTTLEGAHPDESLVPFWQRSGELTGTLAALVHFSTGDRDVLNQLPRLSRIHRAATAQLTSQARAMEACIIHQTALEKVLLAGGLPQSKHAADENGHASSQAPAKQTKPLGWLLHNAGTLERYGPRLGALATAMSHFGFDLHPLDEATNFAQQVGDLGATTAWAMLAEAAVRASKLDAPALISYYEPEEGLALSLITPEARAEKQAAYSITE